MMYLKYKQFWIRYAIEFMCRELEMENLSILLNGKIGICLNITHGKVWTI
jgi:hypothetical protein